MAGRKRTAQTARTFERSLGNPANQLWTRLDGQVVLKSKLSEAELARAVAQAKELRS
jgi:hypothetical protein